MFPRITIVIMLAACLGAAKNSTTQESRIEQLIREAAEARSAAQAASPGSLYLSGAMLTDVARDLRARQVNDLVTILVSDRASAIARGATSASRKSSARSSVGAVLGTTQATGPLANLARVGSETDLQGAGSTSRETLLTTTLTGRVTHVLPNGVMVVEGRKEVVVNSERQIVVVRGLIRPHDVGPANTVRSDRFAEMEVQVNGRGVVGDAIRRPFILYRILLGLLPF